MTSLAALSALGMEFVFVVSRGVREREEGVVYDPVGRRIWPYGRQAGTAVLEMSSGKGITPNNFYASLMC